MLLKSVEISFQNTERSLGIQRVKTGSPQACNSALLFPNDSLALFDVAFSL